MKVHCMLVSLVKSTRFVPSLAKNKGKCNGSETPQENISAERRDDFIISVIQ